jgi:S1-C subfamily serine protease
MSGPKHLWSGDWENEPGAACDRLAARPDDEPAPAVAPPPRPRAPRGPPSRRRRTLAIAIVAVVLIAAGAWGLTALLGSSGSPGSTVAAVSAAQPASVTASSPQPISWLGMEIQTLPPGVAVIETVRLGSNGDRAGLESGDVIQRINNRQIHGTGDVAAAVHGLHPGDRVLLQISQGSSLYALQATLAAPPSAYP